MDVGNPIRSVIPSAHGAVLAVLAGTDRPLSGRGVAELTDGRVSAKGVNLVLRALVDAGVVLADDHPPSKLYRLNRQHLAAEAIEVLAELGARLTKSMRASIATWDPPPSGAWLFGSAARRDGDELSDIDVLIVRPGDVDPDASAWIAQIDRFVESVGAWTGNRCAVVEYGEREFAALMVGSERLAQELRADGIPLTKRRLPARSAPDLAS